jgi:hypothetical protein
MPKNMVPNTDRNVDPLVPTCEIRVVRAGYPVVSERPAHVLVDCLLGRLQQPVAGGEQPVQELTQVEERLLGVPARVLQQQHQ